MAYKRYSNYYCDDKDREQEKMTIQSNECHEVHRFINFTHNIFWKSPFTRLKQF